MENLKKIRVNSPKVVSEIIDGEVVIINLDRGVYYSLLKTGVSIWEGIEKGLSMPEILELTLNLYDGNPEEIAQAVNGFIDTLQQEELIQFITNDRLTKVNVNPLGNFAAGFQKQLFEIPVLEKYTDMQGLMLIDPIHEAADAGWPNTNS